MLYDSDMQQEPEETPQDKNPPENTPTPEPETVPSKLKNRKKWLLASVVVVLLLGISAAVFAARHSDAPAEQQAVPLTPKVTVAKVGDIKTFEDCQAAKDSSIDGDLCTAADGQTFTKNSPSDDTAKKTMQNIDQAAEDNAGSQSVKICLESCEPGYNTQTYYTASGSSTINEQVILQTSALQASTCTLTLAFSPDKPTQQSSRQTLTALASQTLTFDDGINTLTAACPAKNNETLTATRTFRVADRLPEKCANFAFTAPTQSSASTLAGLQKDIVGTWTGCVQTPWWATYYATITFNGDGSYNASSTEDLDGNVSEGGFYDYSIAGPNPSKTYAVTSYQNGVGQGFLDIIHPDGTTIQRGDLRNIKLSGNTLAFDFYHRSQYGPIRFMVTRQ